MNHIVQTTVAALLITGALAYLLSRAWRAIEGARRRKAGGCGPDCGCK